MSTALKVTVKARKNVTYLTDVKKNEIKKQKYFQNGCMFSASIALNMPKSVLILEFYQLLHNVEGFTI